MRLVVLTYRLTKIKGRLVSVGICALSNATLFMGFISGGAAITLAASNIAEAQPPITDGCQSVSDTGTIGTNTSSSEIWAAQPTCAVSPGVTIATTNSTGLATSAGSVHTSLTNNGSIHSRLTGTALAGATIAGFSNALNVGTITNVVGAGITGDYFGTVGSVGGTLTLQNPGNTFTLWGANNQSGGTIASLENDGIIQGTVSATITPNTVAQGYVIGLNNDGSIVSLNNTGTISASLGSMVAQTSNHFSVVGVATSGQIGSLTNSGVISGDTYALVNGQVGSSGNSASIGVLMNASTGTIISGGVGVLNMGTIGAITNDGLIQGNNTGILAQAGSSIASVSNTGTIVSFAIGGSEQGAMVLLGSVSILQNSGSIGEDYSPVAIFNGGGIDSLINTGKISGNTTGIRNAGGTIDSLSNIGTISGRYGVINSYRIASEGSIGTLINSGTIQGIDAGILNQATIGTLQNSARSNLGTITAGFTGLSNTGSIATLLNAGVINGTISRGLANDQDKGGAGSITSISNTGAITGGWTGLYNAGSIGTLTNAGQIQGNGHIGVFNTGSGAGSAVISQLTNSGSISGGNTGIFNGGTGTFGPSTVGVLVNSGTISGATRGIMNAAGGEIDSLVNSGTIQGTGGSLYGIGTENDGSIGSLWNQSVGSIQGNSTGIINRGTITSLTNDGTITTSPSGNDGISNTGTISLALNSGVIQSHFSGFFNGGSIGTLLNTVTGLIHADYDAVSNNGDIATLMNDGNITANNTGVFNAGLIGSLANAGTISGTYAVLTFGTIGALNNSGQIIGGYAGIFVSSSSTINAVGTIGTLTNSGTISAQYAVDNYGLISTLNNIGKILGAETGILNNYQATIVALTNSGVISGASTGIQNDGSIGTLTNSGKITGAGTGVNNFGSISFIANSGTISGGNSGFYSDGAIGTLSNIGLITGGAGGGTIQDSYGVDNEGSIGMLYNDGSISGGNAGTSFTSYGIYNDATITGLLNDTRGTISGNVGLYNSGAIGEMQNNGGIFGTSDGIDNSGSIGTILNIGTSALIAANYAIVNELGATIGMLGNSGVISGHTTGVINRGSIGTLANIGQITGGGTGIWNVGTLTSLINQGLVSAGSYAGIANDQQGSIGTLTNSGTISSAGSTGAGIWNAGLIGTLTNSGRITAASAGVYNEARGTVGMLSNSGTIQGTGTGTIGGNGIYNAGLITSLVNSGVIEGVAAGVYNDSGSEPRVALNVQPQEADRPTSDIVSLTNDTTGTISGGATGIYNAGTIGTLSNAGSISGGVVGVNNDVSGTMTSVANSGTMHGANEGFLNSGDLGTLTNSGTIAGTVDHGLYNVGLIGTLTNSGLMSGAKDGVFNDQAGTITAVSNTGTLSGGANGFENAGSIGTVASSGTISGVYGLSNAGGNIGVFDNSGTITATQQDAVSNDGTIGTMTNEGKIIGQLLAINIDASGTIGSLGNTGLISGPTAIKVAASGSLGAVTNSGTIAGSIVNASASDLSIGGGTGTVFGALTGYGGGLTVGDIGQITNTASNVLFRSGNVLLNDGVNVGKGTVTNSATLQVDNPINITGNYLQTTAGALSVGVASLANHGELNVGSTATVNADGRVELTGLQGFRFAAGEQFTLIDSSSAAYNIGSMTASASGFYGGYTITDVAVSGQQDLVVCLTSAITANCNGKTTYTLATTSNAVSANNAADGYTGSNANLNKLANALTALGTTADANRAGNQLLAEPHHNAVALAEQPALDVLNVVTGHADVTRLAANGGESGVSAGESGSGVATWGEAFGGGAHQSQDGQFSGYEISSEGLVAGGDAAVGESNTRLGAVFTYTHADLNDHGDRTGDSMGLNSYGILGYATFLGNRAYADLTGGVMFDQFSTVRVVDFPGFYGIATGNHDGTEYLAKADGGYRFPMNEPATTTLTPVWGVAYSHLNQDAYTESGGNGAALHVDRDGDNSIRGEAGLKLEQSFKVTRGDVVPELKVMYRHEFDSGSQLQNASFAADPAGTAFSTQNVRPVLNTGVVSAGVNLLGKDGVTVSVKYGAEIGSGYVSQGGSLRVRWNF